MVVLANETGLPETIWNSLVGCIGCVNSEMIMPHQESGWFLVHCQFQHTGSPKLNVAKVWQLTGF